MAFRIGGLVGEKSVRQGAGAEIHFTVTDGKGVVPVEFHGVLPALFREGQGVVATGALNPSGTFMATLKCWRKHDEKYMPPEVVDALEEKRPLAGRRQPDFQCQSVTTSDLRTRSFRSASRWPCRW